MMVTQSGNQNFAQAIFWLHDVHYWLPRATKTLLVSSQALCYIKKNVKDKDVALIRRPVIKSKWHDSQIGQEMKEKKHFL